MGPGTYIWHDHSSANRGEGMSGTLIVRPPPGMAIPWAYDSEYTLNLMDWYHTSVNAASMRLNRY